MRARPITQALTERMKDFWNYDPETGEFTWKVNHGRVKAGELAGAVQESGKIQLNLEGVRYYAHRVVWAFKHGECSGDIEIKHINGVGIDNRLSNLKAVTHRENAAFSKRYSNNSTGYRGVSWHKQHKRYHASIRINGKLKSLGYYKCPQEAHKAYCEARQTIN